MARPGALFGGVERSALSPPAARASLLVLTESTHPYIYTRALSLWQGEEIEVVAEEGKTLLEVAHENDIELEGARAHLRIVFVGGPCLFTHEEPPIDRSISRLNTHANPTQTGACGGELACSTCHVVFEPALFEQLPAKKEEEEDMLDLAWGLTDTCVRGRTCMLHARICVDDANDGGPRAAAGAPSCLTTTNACMVTIKQQVPAGVPDQGDAAAGGGQGDHPGGDQQHAGGPAGRQVID